MFKQHPRYSTILSCGIPNKIAIQRVKNFTFVIWAVITNPVTRFTSKETGEKINDMHNHPVEGGPVFKPGDDVYGRAKDYGGKKGML